MEFDYIVINGPSDIELQLSVRNGEATLLRSPEAPRKDGALIGVFRGPAGADFLHFLEHGGVPPAPSPAAAIRPDMPVIQIRQVLNGTTLSYTVPVPSAFTSLPAMRALSERIARLAATLEATSALRAIGVDSIGLQSGNRWKVKLRNPGSLGVEVDWKSQPVRVFGLHNGELQDLTAGPAVPSDRNANSIPARGAMDIEIPVQFPQKGEWQVRAVYQVWHGTRPESGPIGGAAASKFLTLSVR